MNQFLQGACAGSLAVMVAQLLVCGVVILLLRQARRTTTVVPEEPPLDPLQLRLGEPTYTDHRIYKSAHNDPRQP